MGVLWDFEGMGHPEPLSGNLSGWRSRHIDEKNRIVYKFTGSFDDFKCE